MRRSRLKIFSLYFAPQFSVYTKFGIDPCEVHRCIYLSQQMLLRHQLVYDYELYQISIHFPAFQHLSSPLPTLPYLSEKAQLQPLFFDTLRGTVSKRSLFYMSSDRIFGDSMKFMVPIQENQQWYMPQNML